jgi:hypothetical protein
MTPGAWKARKSIIISAGGIVLSILVITIFIKMRSDNKLKPLRHSSLKELRQPSFSPVKPGQFSIINYDIDTTGDSLTLKIRFSNNGNVAADAQMEILSKDTENEWADDTTFWALGWSNLGPGDTMSIIRTFSRSRIPFPFVLLISDVKQREGI